MSTFFDCSLLVMLPSGLLGTTVLDWFFASSSPAADADRLPLFCATNDDD
jgi:hypothetical protein